MFRTRRNPQEIENSLQSLVLAAINLIDSNDRSADEKNRYVSLYQTTYEKIQKKSIPEDILTALAEFVLQRLRFHQAQHNRLSQEEMITFFRENINGTYSESSRRRPLSPESTPPLSEDDEPGSAHMFR